MQHSANRILTTHVGNLPRPEDLLDLMKAKLSGKSHDANRSSPNRSLWAKFEALCTGASLATKQLWS